MRFRDIIAAIGLIAATLFSGAAQAGDKAAGWAKWADRAELIYNSTLAGNAMEVATACKGVTGVVIGQGFQFPYWGQSLIQVCDVLKAAEKESGNRRRKGQVCSDLRRLAKIMAKAEPVAEEPRAAVVAQNIAKVLTVMDQQSCH
ncbi:MAG: hypothetical protein KF730_02185 [Sphingomonas sp.]|uniref:hypothetical protein n=1 Tax=Sphingomonas sp. TaxID=28214 RepID=UPI0025D99BDA|nr:hypothetical protein [Sphingomonas sp.]MBX3563363.1 hypothetical protein [Sphingomonas sp.]